MQSFNFDPENPHKSPPWRDSQACGNPALAGHGMRTAWLVKVHDDWVAQGPGKPKGPGWPATMVEARYSGAYEGGEWVAFPCYPRDVPADAFGDDSAAMNYWWADGLNSGPGEDSRYVGRGSTSEAALADMARRMSTPPH